MVEKLGVPADQQHVVYHPSVNLAGNASWGNAIVSKFPLYDAASIPNPGGGSFGVWAYAVVDNRKFMLACVHLSATWNAKPAHLIESSNNRFKELTHLRDAWTLGGSPPIVIGGDFNQLPMGNNYELMTREWSDALKELKHDDATFHDGLLQTRIDYFLTSKQFIPRDGAVVRTNVSDHSPIWIELTGKEQASTQPAK
jgi:endonuclease/exonuclease/phosphatase family metal-dependent hydrolase